MPAPEFQELKLRPGVITERSQTENEGSYSFSRGIRFFQGQLQKGGGFSRLPGVSEMAGTCRGLFGWADLVGTPYLAAGTESRLYVASGGDLEDVTPVVHTSDVAVDIIAAAGSDEMTIADAGYQPAPGDYVEFRTHVPVGGLVLFGAYPVAQTVDATRYAILTGEPATQDAHLVTSQGTARYTTVGGQSSVSVYLPGHGLGPGATFTVPVTVAVGGLTLFGNFTVQSVPDNATFTITASGIASSSGSAYENGGLARLDYLLASGQAENTAVGGWGVGDWGVGDWGSSNVDAGTPLTVKLRTWSLDQFGQDLIASPNLGPIYHWRPGWTGPAELISPDAPTQSHIVFCLEQTQIIVALGCEALGTYYPTLIRWCDQSNFEDWLATTTNQAGSYQIAAGSYFTAGMAFELGALVWTDTNLYLMTYLGPDLVFGFNPVGKNCPAISKRAPVAFAGGVVWPSDRGFFRYANGGVSPVECPVWSFLFDQLDTSQTDQIVGGGNSLFSEASWWFPIAGSDVGGVVRVNYAGEQWVWDVDLMTRTAWIDHSPYGAPIGAERGKLYFHETGFDADNVAMQSYAESGYMDLGDGTQMMKVASIIPDFQWKGTQPRLSLEILSTSDPATPPKVHGPFVITPDTTRINCPLRGRQIAFRISSNDVGSWWRLQKLRYSARPAGKRP